ncbi:MAG: hypothetical protein WA849_14215 [Candidatus Udaeobacter sp.]
MGIGETGDEADFLAAFYQHSYQDRTIADKKLAQAFPRSRYVGYGNFGPTVAPHTFNWRWNAAPILLIF